MLSTVVIRQGKPWRRKDSVFMYFEDNAGVIVNPQGRDEGTWACSCWSKSGETERLEDREKEVRDRKGNKIYKQKRPTHFDFSSYFNIRKRKKKGVPLIWVWPTYSHSAITASIFHLFLNLIIMVSN